MVTNDLQLFPAEEEPPTVSNKYITFKRTEWDAWVNCEWMSSDGPEPTEVEDAVVIRRQDVFAPPVLDAYANSIRIALEVLELSTLDNGERDHLCNLADYFHEQAVLSWDCNRKIPD